MHVLTMHACISHWLKGSLDTTRIKARHLSRPKTQARIKPKSDVGLIIPMVSLPPPPPLPISPDSTLSSLCQGAQSSMYPLEMS